MDSAERKKREAEKRARIIRNQEVRINRIVSDSPLVEKTEDDVVDTQPIVNLQQQQQPQPQQSTPLPNDFLDSFMQFNSQFGSQFNGQFTPPLNSPFFTQTHVNIPKKPEQIKFKLTSKVLIFLLSLTFAVINYPTITELPPSIKDNIILLPLTLAVTLSLLEYNTFSKHKFPVLKRDFFWAFFLYVVFTEALEDFYFPFPYQDSYLNLIAHSQIWLSLLTSLLVELVLKFSLSTITSHIKTRVPLVSLLPESLLFGILRQISKVAISIFLISVLPSVFGLELDCPIVFSKLLPNVLCGKFGMLLCVHFSLSAIRTFLEPSTPTSVDENKKSQ